MNAKGKPLPQIRKELLEREQIESQRLSTVYRNLFNSQISLFQFTAINSSGQSTRGQFYIDDPQLVRATKDFLQVLCEFHAGKVFNCEKELHDMKRENSSLFDEKVK